MRECEGREGVEEEVEGGKKRIGGGNERDRIGGGNEGDRIGGGKEGRCKREGEG